MPTPKLPVHKWEHHRMLLTRAGWINFSEDIPDVNLPKRMALLVASERFIRLKRFANDVATLEKLDVTPLGFRGLAVICHDCQDAALDPTAIVSDMLQRNFKKWFSEFPDFTLNLLVHLRKIVTTEIAARYRAMAALRTKSDDIKTVAQIERLGIATVETARRELAKLDKSLSLTKAKKRK
jgi:hypothetical protein